MQRTLFTLARPQTFEQEVKKSRFLAICGPVTGEQEAKDFIAAHSVPKANHNCWAFRLGAVSRSSDDGEPGGTAGKPILQAIDGQDLDGVAVVVTRWFGGVLLGSGGLIRAYGGTAAACLREAEKIRIVTGESVAISCTFGDLALVKARLTAIPDTLTEREDFNEGGATLTVRLPPDQVEAILRMLTDLTGGRTTFIRP